jgi:hypothetical protein
MSNLLSVAQLSSKPRQGYCFSYRIAILLHAWTPSYRSQSAIRAGAASLPSVVPGRRSRGIQLSATSKSSSCSFASATSPATTFAPRSLRAANLRGKQTSAINHKPCRAWVFNRRAGRPNLYTGKSDRKTSSAGRAPSLSLSSISRPHEDSVSTSRQRCLHSPMRSLSSELRRVRGGGKNCALASCPNRLCFDCCDAQVMSSSGQGRPPR